MPLKNKVAKRGLLPIVIGLGLLIPFFFSCTRLDVYEKDTPIPKYEWQSNFTAKGNFIIKDTAAAYDLYLVLRHTDAYKYNNIWLDIGLQQPGDTMRTKKMEFELGTDAAGWQGTGMNDIWEVRILLPYQQFGSLKKAGMYNFTINQVMRDNPLLNVMSAGLRIEKIR